MAKKTSDIQKYWDNTIRRGTKYKEKWYKHFKVEDCYKYFLGSQKPDNYTEEDWFTLNLIYANIRAIIPSLYFREPYLFVRLKRSFSPDRQLIELYNRSMQVREGVLNYLVKENDLVYKGQLCILDAFFQFGVLKSRYVPLWEDNPDADKPIKGAEGKEVIDPATGLPMIEAKKTLKEENFTWDRISPNNIVIDPDATCDSFSWVAQKNIQNLEIVKKNPVYSHTSDLEATLLLSDFDEDSADRSTGFLARLGRKAKPRKLDDVSEDEKLVVLWEIYDISRNKYIVIAEGHDKPLVEENIPPGIEEHPFAFLKFNENPGFEGTECWYPVPEVFNQLGPQKEYGLACNDVALHRKRYKRKYGSTEDLLSDDEMSKFEEPYDGIVVKFTRPTWASEFLPIQDAPLDQAVTFDRVALRRDFDDISGSTAQSQGRTTGSTATETEILESRLQIRESDKQYIIRRFLINAARKMHQLIEENLKTEGAIRIVGPKGENWIPYGPNDFYKIPAEIEFDIDVDSMSPRNAQVERMQWMQFMASIAQMPMIFQDPEVLKWWAEKFDIREEDKLERLAQGMQQLAQFAGQQPGTLQNMPGPMQSPGNVQSMMTSIGGGTRRGR